MIDEHRCCNIVCPNERCPLLRPTIPTQLGGRRENDTATLLRGYRGEPPPGGPLLLLHSTFRHAPPSPTRQPRRFWEHKPALASRDHHGGLIRGQAGKPNLLPSSGVSNSALRRQPEEPHKRVEGATTVPAISARPGALAWPWRRSPPLLPSSASRAGGTRSGQQKKPPPPHTQSMDRPRASLNLPPNPIQDRQDESHAACPPFFLLPPPSSSFLLPTVNPLAGVETKDQRVHAQGDRGVGVGCVGVCVGF